MKKLFLTSVFIFVTTFSFAKVQAIEVQLSCMTTTIHVCDGDSAYDVMMEAAALEEYLC